jgi:hypothetical protein
MIGNDASIEHGDHDRGVADREIPSLWSMEIQTGGLVVVVGVTPQRVIRH